MKTAIPKRGPLSRFLVTVHHTTRRPLYACIEASDHLKAKIIGLSAGLHRGVVSSVEAEEFPMKTKTTNQAGQLLLWP